MPKYVITHRTETLWGLGPKIVEAASPEDAISSYKPYASGDYDVFEVCLSAYIEVTEPIITVTIQTLEGETK